MAGVDPFELEPDDAPRFKPSTVTFGPGDRLPGPRRRRAGLLVLAAIGALGGLIVATGGSTEPEQAVPEATTTTTRPRTTTTRRPTTTAPPSTIGQLLGEFSGLWLLAQNDRGIDLVDLDTGKTQPLEDSSGGRPMVTVVGGGVVTMGLGGAHFHPVPANGAPVALGQADWVLRSAEPGRVWLIRPGPGGTTAVEVAVDGVSTTNSLEMPPAAYPVGPWPGGLLVEALGRIYALTAEGVDPIATGSTVAVSERWLAVHGCDDRLRCGFRLIDLDDGSEQPVALPPGLEGGYFSGTFSPGGDQLAVWVQGNSAPHLVLVDAPSGAVRDLASVGAGNWGNPPAWSPDGGWLFWVDVGIQAMRPDSGAEPVRLNLPGRGYYSIALL